MTVEGNFETGRCFADVRCALGHAVRLFNLGRGHYVACDICRTYVYVGSNLTSNWRRENKEIWEKNYRSVRGYRFIQ